MGYCSILLCSPKVGSWHVRAEASGTIYHLKGHFFFLPRKSNRPGWQVLLLRKSKREGKLLLINGGKGSIIQIISYALSSNTICSTNLWGLRRWIIFAVDKALRDFIWRCVEGIFGKEGRRKHSLDWTASWEHFSGRFAHKKTVGLERDPDERLDMSVNTCIRVHVHVLWCVVGSWETE